MFFFSIVGRWSDSFFFEIVDGFLASRHILRELLDGQLVNELVRCSVGILRPPFLSLCVLGCCPIHDNLKTWRTSFSMLLLSHIYGVDFCMWGREFYFKYFQQNVPPVVIFGILFILWYDLVKWNAIRSCFFPCLELKFPFCKIQQSG